MIDRRAWRSRFILSLDLGVPLVEIDSIVSDLQLTAADQRTLGQLTPVQVLSPDICEVIEAIVARDREGPCGLEPAP